MALSKTDPPKLEVGNDRIFSLSYQLQEVKESRNVICERAEEKRPIVSPIDDVISRVDFVSEMIRLKDYSIRLVCR